MKYILLLNGTFAAGKSTASELLAQSLPGLRICDWDIPEINDLSIVDVKQRKFVREQRLFERVEGVLKNGNAVVIPNTITSDALHAKLQSVARNHGAVFIHLALMISEDEMLKRLHNREYNGSITNESTARTYKELHQFIEAKKLEVIDAEVNSAEQVWAIIIKSLVKYGVV